MKTIAVLLGVAVLTSCETSMPKEATSVALEPPAGAVTLIREAKGQDQGGYDLFLPTRPTPINGNVWVLEAGNDQLVRFDSTLSVAQAFGREGEGPGEIQFAEDLIVAGDRIVVAESGNGRLSAFDTTGVFLQTLPTAESPRFVAEVQGRFVATLNFSPHYVYQVSERGKLTPHAAIPDVIRNIAASDEAMYLPAGPYIAASSGGELFVLDQSVLALSRFDREGRLLQVGLLPEPFRSRLLEQRIEQRKAWGARAAAWVDTPAAKRISLDREGRLLVLFHLPDSWGLLIDTNSWTARPLMLPENRRLHDILWAASDAALDTDRLYVLSGSQLYHFAVEGW